MDKGDPKRPRIDVGESSSPPAARHRSLGHIIPGPAGLVQMALERKEVGIYEGEGLNTQQVIHRALNVASEDNDFLENSAWLSAVREGYLELPEYTDLATVTNLPNLSRVKLVVALVKSCVRNELGSRLLELKDPTGSFWATLHYKACEEGIFPGIYDVGSCLILREIVLFRPTRKSGYLNITLNNVQSVIQKSILD
ncbi:hypothetical protein Vadar_032085 [Vaccinium darrowii]|uniref:Uncharacterized protein n=1 Tax=Vaccinium darrowii TaxID=229202 RepID=A0ACB7XVM5_9ERIC|nr:hypothetical protein Vadar_032085 [Vaccinium darrowii]